MYNIQADNSECQVEVQADYVLEAVDEEIDERNRQISKSVNKIFHTSGSKSYARVAKELVH
jgi:hypothetical protein